jgi:predicted ribosome quality control (RQC) complex YloA/Tae2 family protein
MELAILQLIARELNELLPGAFVNKIHQPLPREIVVRMRVRGGGEKKLMLSADPQLGRIHLTTLRIPNPPRPPRFCSFLRAHFQGAVITEVRAAEDDRVVTVIGARGTKRDRSERRLILELLGRDSNIILVDGSTGRIMDCLHHLPEKESGSRMVLPGEPYEPPPKHGRSAEPLDAATAEMKVSPGIAMGPNDKRRLTLRATPPDDECFDSINAAADALFTTKLGSTLLEQLRRELAAPIKSRIGSLNRRLTKIKADEKRLKDFTERSYEGELLKANLGRIRKGMATIEVLDWDSGQNRIVALDPALSPIENMERIFKKSAKGKRGERAVRQRLSQTLEEKRALEDLLFFVTAAESIAELEEFPGELRAGDQVKSMPSQQNHPDRGQESSLFRNFRTPAGRVVLVGKSGKGNAFLLRKKAHTGDLWFHVKDSAGAHVVLKQQSGEPFCTEDKEFAASLAVHFSKARGKGKTEVMIADVKDIGHPKGAVPGQVTVRSYNTMMSEEIPGDSTD